MIHRLFKSLVASFVLAAFANGATARADDNDCGKVAGKRETKVNVEPKIEHDKDKSDSDSKEVKQGG